MDGGRGTEEREVWETQNWTHFFLNVFNQCSLQLDNIWVDSRKHWFNPLVSSSLVTSMFLEIVKLYMWTHSFQNDFAYCCAVVTKAIFCEPSKVTFYTHFKMHDYSIGGKFWYSLKNRELSFYCYAFHMSSRLS